MLWWDCASECREPNEMKPFGILTLLVASLCYAQDQGDFKPASTNVQDAQYPRVDSASRVQIRIKAPDATKVKANFWSNPKLDVEKQADGFWTVTTPPLAPGLHYYTFNIDGYESLGAAHEWQTWHRDLNDFAPRLFR